MRTRRPAFFSSFFSAGAPPPPPPPPPPPATATPPPPPPPNFSMLSSASSQATATSGSGGRCGRPRRNAKRGGGGEGEGGPFLGRPAVVGPLQVPPGQGARWTLGPHFGRLRHIERPRPSAPCFGQGTRSFPAQSLAKRAGKKELVEPPAACRKAMSWQNFGGRLCQNAGSTEHFFVCISRGASFC